MVGSMSMMSMSGMRPPGVSGTRPAGVGGGPPPGMGQQGIDRLQQGVESGRIDTDQLASRLEDRFGEAASGIVGEDGSVDFEAIKDLASNERSQQMKDHLESRFGDEASSVFNEDGSVDVDKLKELVSSQFSSSSSSANGGFSPADTLLEMLSSGDQTDKPYGPGGGPGASFMAAGGGGRGAISLVQHSGLNPHKQGAAINRPFFISLI